jgi:putative ABC transport system permease protein
MTLRDLVVISTGNLRRMKLRTFLTTAGVMIAIAAFVSMLSFGAGNQAYVQGEFDKLGLFTTMQVYPRSSSTVNDTSRAAKLDRAALDRLAGIKGVNLVYPYDAFSVTVNVGDSTLSSRAQALPSAAIQTKLFSNMLAGSPFDSNTSRQTLVSDDFRKKAGFASPDTAVGQSVILSVRVSTVDSGLTHILVDRGVTLLDRLKRIHLDSLRYAGYRSEVVRTEANETLRRFLNGFLNAQGVIRDTLKICGVLRSGHMGRVRTEPMIVPLATATRFNTSGLSGSPAEIFAAMSSGTLFAQPDDPSGRTFTQATIDFDPAVPFKNIRDSVEALGFRTFSFAAEFEQLQRVFLYFDLALGVVGLIALITASLGIVNTMVMSITERRKEIGVLKSLGADEGNIRALFLVESGVIGILGTTAGIATGWLITRITSAIAQSYMRSQGIPEMELFALPPWLLLLALGFGVGVSILAGLYPAARAARVDPVEALRNE